MAAGMKPEPGWSVVAAVAGAAVLGAIAATARHRILAAYTEPVGVDGYWYAVQLRSLLASGQPAEPTLPVALWFLAPFAAAMGPVSGIKLGAAIGVSLHVLTGFALGRVLARSTAAGMVAAAVVATSPSSIYLTTEFVKQGIALAALAGFLAALAWAAHRPGRGRIALAAASGVVAALAHKLAFAVALAAVAAVAIDRLRRSGSGSRWTRIALVAVAGAGALFLAATRDRWIGAVGADPDLSLPALRFPSGVALRFGHEVAAGAVVALAVIALHIQRLRRGAAGILSPVGWTLAALALFTALPWLAVGDPDGIGFRLRISAHLALAPLGGLLLVQLVREPRAALVAAAIVTAALLALRPLAREEGVVRATPFLVAAARDAAAELPAGAEIVTPDRQIAFLLTWESGLPARTRPCDGALGAATWRVLPDAWLDPEAARALSAEPNASGFHLVREGRYRAMLARLSPAARRRWDDWERCEELSPAPRSDYDAFLPEAP